MLNRSSEQSGFIGEKQKGAQGFTSHESKHRSTPWAAGPESHWAASMFTDVSPLCWEAHSVIFVDNQGKLVDNFDNFVDNSEWVRVPGEHRLSESFQHLFGSLFPHIPEDHHVRSCLPVYSTSLFRTGYSWLPTRSPTEWDWIWTLWCLGYSLSLFFF